MTINALSELKVPLDGLDIHLLVKDYLDRTGINVNFSQNFQGNNWHPFVRINLTQRLPDNLCFNCISIL